MIRGKTKNIKIVNFDSEIKFCIVFISFEKKRSLKILLAFNKKKKMKCMHRRALTF